MLVKKDKVKDVLMGMVEDTSLATFFRLEAARLLLASEISNHFQAVGRPGPQQEAE